MERDITQHQDNRPELVKEGHWLSPAVDIYENPDEYLVRADLPGANKEDLRIHLEESELTIEGNRKVQTEQNGGRRQNVAQNYWNCGFRRKFQLPEGIDRDNVNAELTLGVLTLHLPKAASVKPRQIAVRGE